MKQTPTVDLFRIILVLVSLRVDNLTVTFYFFITVYYVLARAFIQLQDGIKIRKVVLAKKIVTRFARICVGGDVVLFIMFFSYIQKNNEQLM